MDWSETHVFLTGGRFLAGQGCLPVIVGKAGGRQIQTYKIDSLVHASFPLALSLFLASLFFCVSFSLLFPSSLSSSLSSLCPLSLSLSHSPLLFLFLCLSVWVSVSPAPFHLLSFSPCLSLPLSFYLSIFIPSLSLSLCLSSFFLFFFLSFFLPFSFFCSLSLSSSPAL